MPNFHKLAIPLVLSACILPATLSAREGGYIGAGVAHTKWDDTGVSGIPVIASVDDESTGFKVYAGYKFATKIGVDVGGEVAYTDVGTAKVTGTNGNSLDVDATALSLALTVTRQLGDQFEVFGKAGWMRSDSSTPIPGSDLRLSNLDDDLIWGLGGEYFFTDRFSLRGEWETNGDVDGHIFTLSGALHFD